jgi:hypothetical protein
VKKWSISCREFQSIYFLTLRYNGHIPIFRGRAPSRF